MVKKIILLLYFLDGYLMPTFPMHYHYVKIFWMHIAQVMKFNVNLFHFGIHFILDILVYMLLPAMKEMLMRRNMQRRNSTKKGKQKILILSCQSILWNSSGHSLDFTTCIKTSVFFWYRTNRQYESIDAISIN